MSFNFFSTKLFKVLVAVFIFLFFIIFNPYNFFKPIRGAFFFIFSPFQKIGYSAAFEFLEAKNFVSSIGQLKKENERLIEKNQNLLAEKARLSDIEKENEKLRQEIGLLPKDKFNLEAASVISLDPYGHGDWAEIDKGEKNGIKKDMPVIVGDGILVGKIDEVYRGSSKVMLLSNPQSGINAIDLKTNSKGIVRGEYGLGIILDMVLQSESLNAGDAIVTSRIGSNFPSGLLVGTVDEVGISSDRLFQRAVISPPIDFSRLRFVFVIKENN